MADLDDFFAKKDRKKKGSKGFNKANTGVLAKKLEESDRRDQKAEEKAVPLATSEATKAAFEEDLKAVATKSLKSNSENCHNNNNDSFEVGSSAPLSAGNDDEWKNYEDDKKDFSGLKIGALKIEENENDRDEEYEINDDGEKVTAKKSEDGPWKKLNVGSEDSSIGETVKEIKSPASELNEALKGKVSGGTYIPPHLRAGNSVRNPGAGYTFRKKPEAPDIRNELFFPSLSASGTAPEERRKGGSGEEEFEEVRSGGQHSSSARRSEQSAPRLALKNRYDHLNKQ